MPSRAMSSWCSCSVEPVPRPPLPPKPPALNVLKLIQRASPRAPHAVVVPARDRRPEIQVVRVLGDDLDRLVTHADQRGMGGVAVLESALERAPQQAREHAVALGDVERIVEAWAQHLVAHGLERVAELGPRRARSDLGQYVVSHRSPLCRSADDTRRSARAPRRHRARSPRAKDRARRARAAGCRPTTPAWPPRPARSAANPVGRRADPSWPSGLAPGRPSTRRRTRRRPIPIGRRDRGRSLRPRAPSAAGRTNRGST